MTEIDFQIRLARPEDAGPIAECVTAAYGHYIQRIGKLPGPMLDDYADVIQREQPGNADA